MAGLLEWMQTPAGMGLLSAVAGGAAGARRGEPLNSVGRGAMAGLQGYTNAQDQARQDAQTGIANQYRTMQMDQMQQQIAQQKAQQQWQAGLPNVMKQTTDVKAPFQADDPFGEGVGAGMSDVVGQAPDMQARQDYMMRPESPYAEKMLEQQLFPKAPDYKVVGNSLVGIGPEGVKPVYTAPEKPEKPAKLDTIDVPRADGSWQMFQTNPDGTPNTQAPIGAPFKKRATAAEGGTTVVNPALDPFKNEQSLRKEYQDNPFVKSASEMKNAFKTIETAYQRPSAANDLAMATKYMKILDPTSVVRESEFALAVNATGMLDKVYNYANMIKTGQKLNPTQRKDFYDSAKSINDAFQAEADKVGETYRGIGKQYGLTPENVTLGAGNGALAVQSFALPPNAKQYEGKTIKDTKTGKRFQAKGGKWTEIK